MIDTAGCKDHGHLSTDEIGHHCRQAILLAPYPMVLYGHVLAFGVAGFAKAFAEGGHKTCDGIGRPDVEEPYHRHRRLLRARCERPRRRPGELRDEIAAFPLTEMRGTGN